MTVAMAPASCAGVTSGGRRTPFRPSSTISPVPPTSGATTGMPQQSASMMDTNRPSMLLALTKRFTWPVR